MEWTLTAEFSVEVLTWLAVEHEAEAVRNTAGLLRILVGKEVATRVDDRWSQSARDHVLVSAYPLALWFAASWWRLLSESTPPRRKPSNSWRMAHETAAAGGGFLWPRICLSSDGEGIDVYCWPSKTLATEPLRYLTSATTRIGRREFESVIEAFVILVLNRLDATGNANSELQGLWKEVQAERADPRMSVWRGLEARLGFDPGEGPEELVGRVESLVAEAGERAAEDVASLCGAQGDPAVSLAQVVGLAHDTGGVRGRFETALVPKGLSPTSGPPWERGRRLAQMVRERAGLKGDPILNPFLADLLGVPWEFIKDEKPDPRPPLGLAVRDSNSGNARIILRNRHPSGRRFEAARLFVDHVLTAEGERWLPATDARTARQRVQRAFAAELLAPINSLRERLAEDFSDESIEDAAQHFGVSPLLVRSHLANNGLIPPDAVGSAPFDLIPNPLATSSLAH